MYKAILFARDGDWVTDFTEPTKEAVWDHIYNMGSRWYFYPLIFLIKSHGGYTTNKQRIVDVPDGEQYQVFLGKSIKTVEKMVESMADDEYAYLIGAW